LRVLGALGSLLAACGALPARADPAADAAALARVERSLASLEAVRAGFVQDLIGKDGQSTQHAVGTLYLKKPGRFRWDYSNPKQLIVCDGTTLWLYDPELEQATARRVRESLSQTPAMLLSGETRVRDGFTVRDGGRVEGLEWVVLTPKLNDTDFRELRLGYAGEALKRMEFADKLNQLTRVELTQIERNARLPDDLFRFVAPPGVDVIGPGAR
jgi:chaperone LolA